MDVVTLGMAKAAGDRRYQRELAYAINHMLSDLPLLVGSVSQPTVGLLITVPPTKTPVHIDWFAQAKITAAGAGVLGFGIIETTTGAAVDRAAMSRGQNFIAGTFSALQSFAGMANVGPSTVWRSFRLSGFVFRDGGSVLTASLAASNGGGLNSRNTWIRAVA